MPNDDEYEVPGKMSLEDFKILYKLWSSSYDDPNPPRDNKRTKTRLNRTAKGMGKRNDKADKQCDFIQLGRSTPKAQFFINKDGPCGTFGFWLPKSAIVDQVESPAGERYVLVAPWCKVKTIEYI